VAPYLPAGQLEHAPAPAPEYWPAAQLVQEPASAAESLPPAQVLQTPAPAAEYWPAAHGPVTAEAEHADPAGQLVQLVLPLAEVYLPARQDAHTVLALVEHALVW
jgi:hypothetical protein